MICLDEMRPQVAKWNAELAAIEARSLQEKADSRKELADSGDFSTIPVVEGRFIDLAIHKESFLDDSAITTGLDVDTPAVWKTRYAPTVGVVTGSVYGSGTSTMYVTQDGYATLTPFVVDVEEVLVPKLAYTQDPEKLGQRQAALLRQAEAMKLSMETYLVNFLCQQPLGTDLAASVSAQLTNANPYGGKTVYVVDPGVQSGTYETSNNIDVHQEGGITVAVIEAIINQSLLSRRMPRTVHIPVAGMPWRTLMRTATLIGGTPPVQGSNPNTANPDLKSIPPSKWEEIWNANYYNGFALNFFGHTIKFKANNALPAGAAIVTTDQPGAQIFNIKSGTLSGDRPHDPKDFWNDSHFEQRQMAIAVPEPWFRNTWFVNFGATAF